MFHVSLMNKHYNTIKLKPCRHACMIRTLMFTSSTLWVWATPSPFILPTNLPTWIKTHKVYIHINILKKTKTLLKIKTCMHIIHMYIYKYLKKMKKKGDKEEGEEGEERMMVLPWSAWEWVCVYVYIWGMYI